MKLLAGSLVESLVLLLVAMEPAYSQLVSVGVKAGVSWTDSYSGVTVPDGGSSHSNDRYIIGPTAEIHFPFRLSLEVDGLYRSSEFSLIGGGLANLPNGTVTVSDWQIPVLGKYEVMPGPVRPFLDAGVVYRHVSGALAQDFLAAQNPSSAGFAFGGGVGFKLGHIRLSPEVRFTHWGVTAFSNAAVVSSNNQADFLVGITF